MRISRASVLMLLAAGALFPGCATTGSGAVDCAAGTGRLVRALSVPEPAGTRLCVVRTPDGLTIERLPDAEGRGAAARQRVDPELLAQHLYDTLAVHALLNPMRVKAEAQKFSELHDDPAAPDAELAGIRGRLHELEAQVSATPDMNRALRLFLGKLVEGRGNASFSGQSLAAARRVVASYLDPPPAPPSFVKISAGSFHLGSPRSEYGHEPDEDPVEVRLSRDFEIGATVVTQAEWLAVMGTNPSFFATRERCPESFRRIGGVGLCPDFPVEVVSWNEVQTFLSKLNKQEPLHHYRLPTEAEWEFAARAGTQTAYSFGDDEGLLGDFAWFWSNSGERAHAVATRKPNPWGLFDMHGNVFEWVADWYGEKYSAGTDPRGPASGRFRSMRGGCWYYHGRGLRSAARKFEDPDARDIQIGFRLVRE